MVEPQGRSVYLTFSDVPCLLIIDVVPPEQLTADSKGVVEAMKGTTTTATGSIALLAMLVLGVFSAGAASAHEFITTGPLPAKILFLQDNNQLFLTNPGGLLVTCKHFGGEGTGPAGSMTAKAQIIKGTYSKCEGGGTKVNISPIEYEISAEGTVNNLKLVTIRNETANCTVKVFSGAERAGNKSLSKLTFLNNASDILIHSEIAGIVSIAEGGAGACGTPGVEHTEGTYTGLILVWAHGGTLLWK